jgi:hypothetical protein
MKRLIVVAFVLAGAVSTAAAQEAVPDLKGTWTGKGKVLIYGTSELLKGAPSFNDPPKVIEIEISHTVLGQDGNLAWGTTSSSTVDSKDPFAWAISEDNKTVLGSDTDGYYRLTLVAPDRMEKCYAHPGTSPTKSIVATCFMMDRVKP